MFNVWMWSGSLNKSLCDLFDTLLYNIEGDIKNNVCVLRNKKNTNVSNRYYEKK